MGDVIDARYEIVGILPTGGMGELYKVRHLHLGDFRVVKVRKPMGKKDETSQKRFVREARLAAALKHSNLATLYDFSMTPDGAHYMVFEYVDGLTVAEHIKAGGRFETIQVLRVAEQTLRALSVLHNAGIIHRDIASDNLMLAVAPDGETIVKVIDLGIAKPLDGEELTSTGFFVGKTRYASPEQVNTQDPTPIDARSDLYSLGVVLYEMVSGDVPFAGSTPAASVIKRLTEDVTNVPPRDTTMILETDVEAFILSLLRRDREERVHDADDALEALGQLLAKRPDADDGSTLARITRDRELHKLVAESESGDIPVPRQGTLEMSLDEIQKAQLDDLREATEQGHVEAPLVEPPPDQPHVSETESLPKLDKEARDRLMAEQVEKETDAAQADTDQIPIDESDDDEAPPESEAEPISVEEDPDGDAAPTMPFNKYKRDLAPEPDGDADASPPTPFLSGGSDVETLPVPASTKRPSSGTTRNDTPPALPLAPSFEPELPHSQEETPAAPPLPTPASTADKAASTPAFTPPSDSESRKKTLLILALLLVFALIALGVAGYAGYRIIQKISTEPVASAGVRVEDVEVPDESVDFVEPEVSEVNEYGPPTPEGYVAPQPPPPPKPAPRTSPPKPEPEPEPETPEPEPESEPEPPPVPPVVEGDLVQPGPDVQDASIIAKGPLRLPVRARLRRAKGTATVDILIGINGVPDEVRMVKRSGDADIDDAALEAARNSRFIPATKGGVRVRIWKRLDFGTDD